MTVTGDSERLSSSSLPPNFLLLLDVIASPSFSLLDCHLGWAEKARIGVPVFPSVISAVPNIVRVCVALVLFSLFFDTLMIVVIMCKNKQNVTHDQY